MARRNRPEPRQLALIPHRRNGEREPIASLLVDWQISRKPLKAVGLFAGIAGIELGLQRSDHESILLCEIDEGARAVLEKNFHGIELPSDVTELPKLPRATELVTAGFPCQDLSQAGQTKGITGSRSGLVGEVFRLLEGREVPWVLLENVPFMLQLGKGKALDVIISCLEELGYNWAYRVVDTRAFGLPQRRERVFLLASLEGDPRNVLFVDDAGEPRPEKPLRKLSFGFYWTEGTRGLGAAVDAVPTLKGGSAIGIPSPPAIVLPSGRIVTPDIRDAERMQGFDSDWTLPAEDRTHRTGYRWKLVGNAVTVDVAEWIGLRLRAPGLYDASLDAPLVRKGAWPRAAWGIGGKRHASGVSAWPLAVHRKPLHRFLQYDRKPLSARATAGFRDRLFNSRLSRPAWFDRVLSAHLDFLARGE